MVSVKGGGDLASDWEGYCWLLCTFIALVIMVYWLNAVRGSISDKYSLSYFSSHVPIAVISGNVVISCYSDQHMTYTLAVYVSVMWTKNSVY